MIKYQYINLDPQMHIYIYIYIVIPVYQRSISNESNLVFLSDFHFDHIQGICILWPTVKGPHEKKRPFSKPQKQLVPSCLSGISNASIFDCKPKRLASAVKKLQNFSTSQQLVSQVLQFKGGRLLITLFLRNQVQYETSFWI